ncbi:MAG: DUF6776 family protein [Reinekea sp.]|jgi:hypothetical protein|nr:DUF6776 family protein [Reinekea sp.]MDX1472821.1 DUF6776 family protein [Reinekea sp.]
MSKVKGSAVTNYRVVPYAPVKHAALRFAMVVVVVGMVYAAFWYGQRSGIREEAELISQRNQLLQEVTQSTSREEALRQRVAVLENAAFVDKGSVDDVRQINRELSDQIAQLEEEIALYQGIMSPSVDSAGLTIQEVTLTPTPAENRYRFKVMLTQVGNNTNYLRGFVGINVLGVQDGAVAAFPLKELSSEINEVDIKFRYRYFQDFKGELVLPEGFTPDQIQVIAQSVGTKSARVEKAYNWSDLENGTNVGQ